MAKGYSVGDLASGAAKKGIEATGKGIQTGQSALDDSTNNINEDIDIQDEQSSDMSKDAGDALSEGGDAAKGAVEAPGRIVQTAKDVKQNINNKKSGKKPNNPKKPLKNKPSSTGGNAAKNAGNGVKNGANAAKNTAKAAKDAANAAQKSTRATQKATETTGKAISKAVEITGKLLKSAWRGLKSALGSIFRKIGAAIVSLFANPYFWIIVLIIVVIILLGMAFMVLGDTFLDSASTRGDVLLNHESSSERNNLTLNDNDEVVQSDVSSGTKIVTAYYTYYSTKSLWVLFNGDIYNCRADTTTKDPTVVSDKLPKETVTINGVNYEVMKPIQYGSAEFIDIFQYDPFTGSGMDAEGMILLQDKYKRESNFYLSADSIASIDNTLHGGDFRYPEQIVQKVKYKVVIDDPATGAYHYELDDLADIDGMLYKQDVYDEDGNLLHKATTSTKYTQNESETSAKYEGEKHGNLWLPCIDANGNVSQTTVGVWDYGFGSILHYMKYIEAHENRGEVKSFEVIHNGIWDLVLDNNETDPAVQTITTSKITGKSHDYLSSLSKSINLYKNAVIETISYADWNALDELEKANYFTGEGALGDPTHEDFNKHRVYGLPSTISYMIDWVVTPAGTVTTNVQTIWKDSGIPFSTIENDGNADFSDSEFDGKDYGNGSYEQFNNGEDNDIVYTDTTVTVQTVTHMGVGDRATATFNTADIKFDKESGRLIENPSATVYMIRYVPTDNDDVNAKFSYEEFTENGETKYVLTDAKTNIFMFEKISTGVWECRNCGEAPAKITYKLNNHSGCKSFVVKIPVWKNGKSTGETRNYTVTYTGTLKMDSSTGKITNYPKAYYPPDYCEVDRYGVVTWKYKPHEKYSNGSYKYKNPKLDEDGDVKYDYWLTPNGTYKGTCRVCNQQIGKAEYKAINHDGCCEVKYEYDVIETKEMKVSQKIVDVDGTANDQYVFPGGYVQLSRTIEGTQWDKEPTYSGEPDTSKVTGQKYYVDYFTHYESYISSNVQGAFDFDKILEQTGLEQEELLKFLEREELSQSVATLGGIEDYFIGGVPEVDANGTVRGYVGPGLGIIAFENGMPATEKACRDYMEKGGIAKPNIVSTLAKEGWPNYGCCQMNRGTLDGFRSWMLADAEREALWDKLFGGIEYDISSESTGFSQAWRDSNITLTEDEYITFMVYQIAYMYKIKVADSWASISKAMPNFENYRASQEMVLACGNNGGLSGAIKYGDFGTTARDMVNRLADIYSTYISFGNYTAIMRNKYDKYIRQYYLIMDEYNLPVFVWDEEKEMFDIEGFVGSSGGWSFEKLWNKLLQESEENGTDIFYPWNTVFKNSQINIVQHTTSSGKVIYGANDSNTNLGRTKYEAPKLTETDIDYQIAKIFATADKVPVSTYQPVTDRFFQLRYQTIFDSTLSYRWTSVRKGVSSYLPDGWTGVFVKDKDSTIKNETGHGDVEYTIVKEFDATENPIVKTLVTYGGTDTDESGKTVKKPITIHSVSKGVVIDMGADAQYGGNYIAIQYKKSVVYYGGVYVSSTLGIGDTVYKKTPLGTVASGDYFYIAMKTSASTSAAYIDPTQLLKGGLQEVVDLAREFLGYDYEWGGHGDKSCFSDRCVCEGDHRSYLNGKMYGFDCSGLVTYVFKNLGFEYGSGGWVAKGADGYRDIGEDVTLDYMNPDGSIDWDSVPAGILVYFDWNGDGNAEHIGIWSGENSLVHASGGNPYLHDDDGNYILDENGNYQIGDVTRNHAVHDCMIKEYFMGDVPSGAYNSPYAIENGLNTLRAGAFGSYYMSCVLELRDFSQYQK